MLVLLQVDHSWAEEIAPALIPAGILRHIGLLEADEDKIRKIRPKGTLFRTLYAPREAIRPKGG